VAGGGAHFEWGGSLVVRGCSGTLKTSYTIDELAY